MVVNRTISADVAEALSRIKLISNTHAVFRNEFGSPYVANLLWHTNHSYDSRSRSICFDASGLHRFGNILSLLSERMSAGPVLEDQYGQACYERLGELATRIQAWAPISSPESNGPNGWRLSIPLGEYWITRQDILDLCSDYRIAIPKSMLSIQRTEIAKKVEI